MGRTHPLASRFAIGCATAVLYAILAVLVSQYAERLLKPKGATSEHRAAVRACVAQPSEERLDDVGGLEAAKAQLRRHVLLPLRNPGVFFSGVRALRPPKGVLLHGPPGTGKTMLARALAAESGASLIALTAATLENKWWGESAKIVQTAFALARTELQPCILFFDEIDGLGRARSEMDASHVYGLKTELLRNLDGAETANDAAMVTLACTNCVAALDPALRRRLPCVIEVSLPDEAARLDILRKLTREEAEEKAGDAADGTDERTARSDPRAARVARRKKKAERDERESTLVRVAALARGFTGSDLAALYAEASSLRLAEADLASMLEAPDADVTSAALLRRVGPLSFRHWQTALQGTARAV